MNTCSGIGARDRGFWTVLKLDVRYVLSLFSELKIWNYPQALNLRITIVLDDIFGAACKCLQSQEAEPARILKLGGWTCT
jgi:hypothetical protein